MVPTIARPSIKLCGARTAAAIGIAVLNRMLTTAPPQSPFTIKKWQHDQAGVRRPSPSTLKCTKTVANKSLKIFKKQLIFLTRIARRYIVSLNETAN